MSSQRLAVMLCSAGALLGAAWLPFAGERWSSLAMAGGYQAAGANLRGLEVAGFHLLPHLVGVVLVVSHLVAARSPRFATAAAALFAATWATCVLSYWGAFLALPQLRWRWGWIAFGAVCSLIVATMLARRAARWGRAPRWEQLHRGLSLALLTGAALTFMGVASFSVIEDDLPLAGGGAVVGAAVVGLVWAMWSSQTRASVAATRQRADPG